MNRSRWLFATFVSVALYGENLYSAFPMQPRLTMRETGRPF